MDDTTNTNGALVRPRLAVGFLWAFSAMCGLLAALLLSSGLLTPYGEPEPQFLSWKAATTALWVVAILFTTGVCAISAYAAHWLRGSEFTKPEETRTPSIKWAWYEYLLVGAILFVSFIEVVFFT